jgi:hypothetical protein
VLSPAITLSATDNPGGRRRRQGPRARDKWLTGSIATTSQQVISQVFDQATQRDPTGRRTWVVLVDGARHQLDLIHAEAARRKVRIHVLIDFIHVLEYLWKAAWCFHQDADPAAEAWVAAHGVRILAGEVDAVITDLGQQATHADLTAQARTGVDACIGYLTAKRDFLGYDTALAAGWPIATGVIEGACRHLIGDPLDITGARWAWPAPKPSSSCAPCAATATSTATGPTTSPRNTDASTKPATSTHPPARPNQPVPTGAQHPSQFGRLRSDKASHPTR